jgi:hypothetical protein
MGPSRGKNSVGSTRPVHNVMVALALAATVWGQAGWSEPKRYDPDPQTCQADNIRKAFLANLLPWQDQPDAVRQRLRRLQAAMTLDTLRECQAKGLLSPEQAKAVVAELGLQTPPAGPPEPSQSPARP